MEVTAGEDARAGGAQGDLPLLAPVGAPGEPPTADVEDVSSRVGHGLPGGEHVLRPHVAVHEVLGLDVRHLAELPVPCTLVLAVEGIEAPVYFSCSRVRAPALATAGAIVATPLEYEAIAVALAAERCTRGEVLEGLRAKLNPLGHRITLERLVGVHRRGTGPLAEAARPPHGGRGDRVERWPAPGQTWHCPVSGRALLQVPSLGRPEGAPRWTFAELLEALGAELVDVEIEEDRST